MVQYLSPCNDQGEFWCGRVELWQSWRKKVDFCDVLTLTHLLNDHGELPLTVYLHLSWRRTIGNNWCWIFSCHPDHPPFQSTDGTGLQSADYSQCKSPTGRNTILTHQLSLERTDVTLHLFQLANTNATISFYLMWSAAEDELLSSWVSTPAANHWPLLVTVPLYESTWYWWLQFGFCYIMLTGLCQAWKSACSWRKKSCKVCNWSFPGGLQQRYWLMYYLKI